jgi:carbamoyltransferase
MTNRRFARLFGVRRRAADEPLEQHHLDLAASIQAVTEEIVCRLVRDAVETYGVRTLCFAGGVGLNCVANGVVLRRGLVDALWIQPAAGDAGGALGAAYAAYYQHHDPPRTTDGASDGMCGAFLGPAYDQADIERRLTALGATFRVVDDEALYRQVVEALTEHKVVGWYQGRMEFGPRALGSRSILADARSPDMQRTLNLKIKYRESFRPFAPAVLEEHAEAWFDLPCPSPYMSLVGQVRPEHRVGVEGQVATGLAQQAVVRSTVPAITHVDYSSRLQTVSQDTNPRFHRLLDTYREATGCPMLVNTSFNVRGEPIVCTPEDAFRCFVNTEMDVLAIGDCYLEKAEQDPALHTTLQQDFDAD